MSGISASGAVATDPRSACRYVPIRKDQIHYVQNFKGEWKLNSKVSPIPPPPGMKFDGYWWDSDRNVYAFFPARTPRMEAGGPARAAARTSAAIGDE